MTPKCAASTVNVSAALSAFNSVASTDALLSVAVVTLLAFRLVTDCNKLAVVSETDAVTIPEVAASIRLAAATAILDRGNGKPSITQIDDSVAHEIKAFEVVADC